MDSARAEAWKLEDEVKVKLRKDQNNFSLLRWWVSNLVGNIFWNFSSLTRLLFAQPLGTLKEIYDPGAQLVWKVTGNHVYILLLCGSSSFIFPSHRMQVLFRDSCGVFKSGSWYYQIFHRFLYVYLRVRAI